MKNFIFIISILYSSIVVGQNEKWTSYTEENTNKSLNTGINSFIGNFIIDNAGNKWFLTAGRGITRFDGKNWYNYTDENTNGIIKNHKRIVKIEVSTSGLVIAYFVDQEQIYFDGKNWQPFKVRPIKFINYQIDKNNKKWILTNKGLATIGEKDELNYLKNIDTNQISYKFLSIIKVISENQIWFKCDRGEYKFNGGYTKNDNELVYFDGKKFILHDSKNFNTDKNISDVKFDSKNNMWISFDGAGVAKFEGNNWINYNLKNTNKGLAGNNVMQLFIDSKDNIWSIQQNGNSFCQSISKFDGNTWVAYNAKTTNKLFDFPVFIQTQPINNYFYENNIISEDKSGNIWLASSEGIYKFENNEWKAFNIKNKPDLFLHNNFVGVECEKNGDVWLIAGNYLIKVSNQ